VYVYWVAVASASLLLVLLEGSAIFVFDGGEVFPDLIMVLLGYSWVRRFVGSWRECSRARFWFSPGNTGGKCVNFVPSVPIL
jgi:predicted Co/Zn/Cd cation transporter (cation efflux family)